MGAEVSAITRPEGLTVEAIRDEVLALADEHPDATYVPDGESKTCSYVRGSAAGQPGCLLGQALIRLGVDPDELAEVEGVQPVGVRIIEVLDAMEVPRSNVVESLAWAQDLQDDGVPWGSAVRDLRAQEVQK